MALDANDMKWLLGQFKESREHTSTHVAKLHSKIEEHSEADVLAFSGIQQRISDVKAECKEDARGAVKEHETEHHAIGWPKIMGAIASIVGVLGFVGMIALWLWKHGGN